MTSRKCASCPARITVETKHVSGDGRWRCDRCHAKRMAKRTALNTVASAAVSCAHCGGADVLGPFEMDGWADGRYQVRGLWWTFCRDCAKHARVPAPLTDKEN